jgi:hypothetical protein
MEKHVMRLSYGLCLASAALALITRILSALSVPSVIFPGSGMSAVSYHSFMDGVILFFMVSVTTAAYVWVKKQFE